MTYKDTTVLRDTKERFLGRMKTKDEQLDYGGIIRAISSLEENVEWMGISQGWNNFGNERFWKGYSKHFDSRKYIGDYLGTFKTSIDEMVSFLEQFNPDTHDNEISATANHRIYTGNITDKHYIDMTTHHIGRWGVWWPDGYYTIKSEVKKL